MFLSLELLCVFMGLGASAPVSPTAPPSPPEGGAAYRGLEEGAFMRRWLIAGPFPVPEGGASPDSEATQREAFARDDLHEHGGETRIRPTAGLRHGRGEESYSWQPHTSRGDAVNLLGIYGMKTHVIAYAWAEIEMTEPASLLLGIGSDDAVKVWLNGDLVHENWADRPVRPDDDVVPVRLRAGTNSLLLKVQNGREAWGFACRALDPRAMTEKLFAASAGGDLAQVRQLLAHGADVHARNGEGFTPLHVARAWGREDVAGAILEKGADPKIEMPAAGTPAGLLKALWKALKENYPMMEYAGAFGDTWYEECGARVSHLASLREALPIMDAMLVRRLHDYHTRLDWPNKPRRTPPPIQLGFVEGKLAVLRCLADVGIRPGDIVMEIDGNDAGRRFKVELSRAFGATPYARVRSACRAVIEGEPGSEARLKLLDPERKTYEVALKREDPVPRPSPVLSSRVLDDNTGYIRISRWAGFSAASFDTLLEDMREKPYLVIDVRGNGGGSDRLAEEITGRFISRDVLSSIAFDRVPGTNDYKMKVMLARPRGPWRYEGRVAVLIDDACASACEHFVSGMIEAGATLVGTPTTGACGLFKRIDLPLGITLWCSIAFPLHGKIPSPLNGIPPNHLVEPTIEDIRQGRDPVLEAARNLMSNPSEGASGQDLHEGVKR